MVSNTTFSYAILSWFRDNGRALPWRGATDPYPIWLSEVILQQTRIAQGWEYWERFMRHFPTVEALASASEDEVLRLWQGLGYYSRARNLHAAARQIVALGQFPSTLEGIRQLKGVGDYTAAAIASFAFDIRAAVVDGNVYRVLSRHFGISTPINSTQGKKEFAALAQSLLPSSEVSAYNQGIMDFGALQCTPLSPRCSDCPLMESCEAFRTGRVEELPVKQRKLQIKTRRLAYIYIRCRESASSQAFTAIHRRGEGDIWQGLWEPFNASLPDGAHAVTPSEILQQLDCGAPDARLRLLSQGVKHVLTHRILLADFYLLEVSRRPLLPPDYIWIPESEIDCYGVPRLIEKMLSEVHEE